MTSTRGHELLDGLKPGAVIADKGYDADHLRDAIGDMGAEAVIPPRSNRKTPRDHDKALYRERNLAERFFNKLKQFRRVATPLRQAPAQLQRLRPTRRHSRPASVKSSLPPSNRVQSIVGNV